MSSKLFDKRYLENEFQKLNEALYEPVCLYLIGGGSMSFQKYVCSIQQRLGLRYHKK